MEGAPEQPPWQADASSDEDSSSGIVDEFAERPEVFVGAAFAGGLALALILRRLGQ
jgi:hypothetical protein